MQNDEEGCDFILFLVDRIEEQGGFKKKTEGEERGPWLTLFP